jgi:hypothetical protein
MSAAAVFRTIQLVLAPGVMITSCGIIINGVLVRYGAISDRMRAIARERLELVWGSPGQPVGDPKDAGRYVTERLEEIDHQMPLLLQRHRLLRNCLQALYLAMLVFVVSMFVIGLAAWVDTSSPTLAALFVFLSGQVILLVGLYWNATEIRVSNQAVEYEAQRVGRLREERR